MGEIVTFPGLGRGGAVRRALDEVPPGQNRFADGVAEGASQLARYTTIHHRIDLFVRQCDGILKPKAGQGGKVIPFAPLPRPDGG